MMFSCLVLMKKNEKQTLKYFKLASVFISQFLLVPASSHRRDPGAFRSLRLPHTLTFYHCQARCWHGHFGCHAKIALDDDAWISGRHILRWNEHHTFTRAALWYGAEAIIVRCGWNGTGTHHWDDQYIEDYWGYSRDDRDRNQTNRNCYNSRSSLLSD